MGKQLIELHPISRAELKKRIRFRQPDIQGAEYTDAYRDTTFEDHSDLLATYHGGYSENPISIILNKAALKRFELQVALFLIENPEVHIEILLGSANIHTAKRRPITRERLLDDLEVLCSKINVDIQNNDYGDKNLFRVFAYFLLTRHQLEQRKQALRKKKQKFGNHGRF